MNLEMRSSCEFLPKRARVRLIVPMTDDNYLFQLSVEDEALAKCQPGQFLQVWVPGVGECPISVCSDRQDGAVELCIRRVGRVTDAIFKLGEGDWIGVRGPYGNGFPIERMRGKNVCLVAGGLGIAPIRSLTQHIIHNRDQFGDVVLVYGMRHSIDLLFRHEIKVLLRRTDIQVFIGAEEIKGPELPPVPAQLGRVADMLRMAPIGADYHAAICGPPVMYPYVVNELKVKGVSEDNIHLSLERHMKCGVGKCGHCYIGGRFACRSGPVFNLSELRFLPEAIECEGC